jgi:hypothetical protein
MLFPCCFERIHLSLKNALKNTDLWKENCAALNLNQTQGFEVHSPVAAARHGVGATPIFPVSLL